MCGKYQFLRLPFWLSCCWDTFQIKIHETNGDMPNVFDTADNIALYRYDSDS